MKKEHLKRFVVPLEQKQVFYHFKNCAARAKAIAACPDVADMRNAGEITAAVQAKLIDLRLVQEFKMQKTTVVYAPKQAGVKKRASRPGHGFTGIPRSRSKPDRGIAKREARLHAKAIILVDRLIEQWPTRAKTAKTEERMLNWFIAAVMEGTDAITDQDWLRTIVNDRLQQTRNA